MKFLAQLAGKFAQLRREESNAARTQIAQEKWEREVASEEKNERACGPLMPTQSLLLQRMYIDMFSDATMRALLPEPATDSGTSAGSAPAQSDLIRPDSIQN